MPRALGIDRHSVVQIVSQCLLGCRTALDREAREDLGLAPPMHRGPRADIGSAPVPGALTRRCTLLACRGNFREPPGTGGLVSLSVLCTELLDFGIHELPKEARLFR
mmetsp:Transcript_15457/g.35309  ORF Transcript_15457/g.35309 Transcript_15457/m.35309 type:complete len:107 (+) Transcript_15457:707-1027(+)